MESPEVRNLKSIQQVTAPHTVLALSSSFKLKRYLEKGSLLSLAQNLPRRLDWAASQPKICHLCLPMLGLQVHAMTPGFPTPFLKCGFQGNKMSPLLKTTDLEKTEKALCRDLDSKHRPSANSHRVSCLQRIPPPHPRQMERPLFYHSSPIGGFTRSFQHRHIPHFERYTPPTVASFIKGAIFQSLIIESHQKHFSILLFQNLNSKCFFK